MLLENIQTRPKEHWWFLGRHIWSEDMTSALEQEFVSRSAREPRDWGRLSDRDWILSELLMELPIEIAEPILRRHWDHLRLSPYYVQAALYFASPALCRLAKEAIDSAPEPAKMLEYIDHHLGIKVTGRTGITRREQFEAIVPYLHFLEKLPILHLWEVCNERGWFDLRRQYLDALVTDGRDAEYLHRANTFAALDRMASEEHRWIDLWLAGFLETGISHEAVFDVLTEWLSCRKTIAALEVVAGALIQIGRRSDLHIWSAESIEGDDAQAIVADTTFAVRRKTLH
jgi:hypothetical protein